MRSKHPIDECLRRGIIEEFHHDIAKRVRNYRGCAVSKLSGRAYNAAGARPRRERVPVAHEIVEGSVVTGIRPKQIRVRARINLLRRF